jgi:glucokinase
MARVAIGAEGWSMPEHLVGAIDIGGTKTAVGLVRPDGTVVAHARWPTPPRSAPAELVRWVVDRWGEMRQAAGVAAIEGIGLSAPGPVDPGGTLIHRIFDWGWRDVPLAALLAGATGLRVRMDNDVNCCAVAEGRWGAAVGRGDFLWMQVSTGVGGGLIQGGRLYAGAHGQAGEIGHIRIQRRGAPCTCGQRGCLETLISGPAIVRRYRAAGAAAEGAEEVFAAADAGDPRARRLLRSVAVDLGTALIAAISLLDPDMVVLGGGVMAGFAGLLPVTRAVVEARATASGAPGVPVVLTRLGAHAALLGAAALALAEDRQP